VFSQPIAIENAAISAIAFADVAPGQERGQVVMGDVNDSEAIQLEALGDGTRQIVKGNAEDWQFDSKCWEMLPVGFEWGLCTKLREDGDTLNRDLAIYYTHAYASSSEFWNISGATRGCCRIQRIAHIPRRLTQRM
jgi:hypothetical protein